MNSVNIHNVVSAKSETIKHKNSEGKTFYSNTITLVDKNDTVCYITIFSDNKIVIE